MSKGKILGLIIAVVVLISASIGVVLLLGGNSGDESDDDYSKEKTSKPSISSSESKSSDESNNSDSNIDNSDTSSNIDTSDDADDSSESDTSSTISTLVGKEKIFSKSGLSITLTEDFVEKTLLSQTSYYESMTSIVSTLKEPFENLEAIGLGKDSTLKEYAQAVIETNGFDKSGTTIQVGDGFTGFEYTSDLTGATINYVAVVFKSHDAFWLVQFACHEDDYTQYSPIFNQWAKTIVFT